jgi:hypothetical protein
LLLPLELVGKEMPYLISSDRLLERTALGAILKNSATLLGDLNFFQASMNSESLVFSDTIHLYAEFFAALVGCLVVSVCTPF